MLQLFIYNGLVLRGGDETTRIGTNKAGLPDDGSPALLFSGGIRLPSDTITARKANVRRSPELPFRRRAAAGWMER